MAQKPKTAASRRGRSRRGKGRPADSGSTVGPEALISAAIDLLKTTPPAQVTRAAVARHAQTDPNLIRYYFKDRDSLLLAVLNRIVSTGPMRSAPTGTAAEQLERVVRGFFAFNASHPYLHRLLVEEVAQSSSATARLAFHELNHRALQSLREIAKQASQDKTLGPFDALHLHVAIIGMCEFFSSSRVLLEDALGEDYDHTAVTKRYGEFIAQLVVNGLSRRNGSKARS